MTHCNTCQENHDDPCRGIYNLDTRLLELRDERIAELEAALRAKQDQWEAQCKKTIELETELAWWERNFLTADGDDAPTKLRKAEAEVERLKEESRVPGHTHPGPCCLWETP